jgi:chromatin structure-remodeling complex subunit RSC1/2
LLTVVAQTGDWVHIQNTNDFEKPTVAQIFRMWQDAEGTRFINACWYYRPEQTVHHVDKRFFENEVVKTGQYRDHRIEEVLDHCFVMFVTRYGKGRPRGLPRDKEVYVCEARYNEEKFRFNKIKTWASCVPDEVRDKDYEMELFDAQDPQRTAKLKKYPSPIKHLLREDAKETDEMPKPSWGSNNAPPIVGAVHRRPREANVSCVDCLDFHSCPDPALLSALRSPLLYEPDSQGRTFVAAVAFAFAFLLRGLIARSNIPLSTFTPSH